MPTIKHTLLYLLTIIAMTRGQIVPTGEIMLYPNTQNSPSLYLISFKTGITLQANQYILISMDWLSSTIKPHSCILVNTTIDIRCTNLVTPTAFTLGFTTTILQNMNPQISTTRTIAIELLDPLPAGVQYFLELALLNVVENIKKISPSLQFYTIDNTGLLHEVNYNFGPVAYKPPITNVLGVTVYTDINNLALGVPGKLVTLKAQIRISVPVSTPLSSMFFILQSPFEFSQSSYMTVDEAEQYATSPIALNSKPTKVIEQVLSPHIFYVAFNQSFQVNRKFIILITQIKNPFFLASSNVSIYTANFNSLTPLQAYQSLFPLKTVTQTLTITVGLPYDIPMGGPCVFYRSDQNYYKAKFYMPNDVPAGYAIKVIAFDNTIFEGTAYVNFESLTYTTIYDYFGGDYFIMRGMGPIAEGSLITIQFKGSKSTISNFYIQILIDTEAVISAGTATSYMFSGRADLVAVDSDDIFQYIYSSPNYEAGRVDSAMTGTEHIRLYFYPYVTTSTGSYVEMYLSPEVTFDPNFDPNVDCTFSGTVGTAVCNVVRTANYVYIEVKPSASYSVGTPNAFVQNSATWLYIYKVRFPRPNSAKYPSPVYFRLFNSSAANPTTYIQGDDFNVMPRPNTLSGLTLTQMGNVNTSSTLNYPAFVRFESKTPSQMHYILQQNQIKVLSIYSSYAFRGLGTYKNNDPYPCTSNLPITCIYRRGIFANGNWWQMQKFSQIERIDVYFNTTAENTTNFHILIPDGINNNGGSYYYYYYQLGIYNKLTKDYKYLYRNSGFYRNPSWVGAGANNQATMTVDFQGKAGSYRNNVTITVSSSSVSTNYQSYVAIASTWSLFQNGLAAYTTASSASTNPQFYSNQLCPLSVKTSATTYLAVFPFKITSSQATFKFYLDNLHMPYHYDLPNYYIYVISNGNNDMVASNQFEMTNQGIFYEAYLKSLTISCLQNYLGVQNTICTVTFGTQSPLRANGQITLVFSGMNVATDECSVFLPNGTKLVSTCSSTTDNKNVTISLTDTYNSYHYPADTFTASVNGISIIADQISQSVTMYLYDSTGKYVIETGNRILTTTVARPSSIEIDEIVYKYVSPLSANKISIRFYLPRNIYSDERLGFIMGKDLSDVNLELERMRIVLTRSDGLVLSFTNQLITEQYKVLFTFTNSAQLTATNYTLEIYGIMTPVSHENGAFSIIYQRRYDKAYTLTNAIKTSFPAFNSRISSNISIAAYFNTEGYEQKLVFTLINTKKVVNSDMVWIINFPSYYNEKLFNYNPYCMIDTTPIECIADPTTRYQLIIRNSPKIITNGTVYTISVHRLTCPRAKYTNDYYRSYYLFVGVLEKQSSSEYSESALLYPEQAIQSTVSGILTISDLVVNTLSRPTFSSIYAITSFTCNVAIPSGSYLYLIFPYEFDNFNNNNINIILKVAGAVVFSASSGVVDRTLEIAMTTGVAANTAFNIEFPSLPTPKVAGSVKMSEMIGFITPADKKSILAASTMAGNSAPILTFTADPRYLSFNHDNTIDITAGTYSQLVDITASDNNPFLTNIVVNISSPGFVFEPASVFLKLGDSKAQFRVGADSGLFPISYFYETVKSEQVFTYYTITKNNNIRVTNNPVLITLPTTISIPLGGCSTPFTLDIGNPPLNDVSISFNYDNQVYNESLVWPNVHTTKSQLTYSATVTQNVVSFCVASSFGGLGLASSFVMRFVLAGTNYRSYQFTPSQNVTINIVAAITLSSPPSTTITLINRQKTFLDFNITPSVPGIVYYHFQIGQNIPAMTITQLQVHLKNNENTIQSMKDFMTRLYVSERDMRTGLNVRTSTAMYTLRISDLLPERYYTLCLYLETFNSIMTQANCLSVYTQTWGVIMRAKISFTSALTADNLNKILCFFTKNINTQVGYVVDLQGNSCYNRAVQNLHYRYPGTTFSSQNAITTLYVITNPYLTSDPSPTAFLNMYNSSSQLTPASISAALSGFAISYLYSLHLGTYDAITMTSRTNAQAISISFDQPVYNANTATISVPNIRLSGYGTAYFLLVLYKQVNIDGNNSYVKIRLNADPSEQQILNCQNWQGNAAEGCARSTYSYVAQTVTFPSITSNCMYKLYYLAASQYPLRPIVSSKIQSSSVVTFVWEGISKYGVLLGIGLLIMAVM